MRRWKTDRNRTKDNWSTNNLRMSAQRLQHDSAFSNTSNCIFSCFLAADSSWSSTWIGITHPCLVLMCLLPSAVAPLISYSSEPSQPDNHTLVKDRLRFSLLCFFDMELVWVEPIRKLHKGPQNFTKVSTLFTQAVVGGALGLIFSKHYACWLYNCRAVGDDQYGDCMKITGGSGWTFVFKKATPLPEVTLSLISRC